MSNPEQALPADRAAALEALMETYGTRILHLAYSYLRDRHLAEDVAQEVFIRAYRNWQEFRGESSVYTWLYRITVNLCKDKKRSAWLRRFFLTAEDGRFEEPVEGPEPQVAEREGQQELLAQVLALPEIYREVLFLHYYEDFSVTEISDLIGLNANTVKTRLRRGRQLLKERLGGEPND